MSFNTKDNIIKWLEEFNLPAIRDRILELGLLTGWRKSANNYFYPPNFERALVLYRLVQLVRPNEVLELGTGRGLGCLSVAFACLELGLRCNITTIDILSPDTKQQWPIQINGKDDVISASRNEIWDKYIDRILTNKIKQITGATTRILPNLLKENKRFDLIFIDAAHDPFSVIHDLVYAIKLITPEGVILMDDFAPLDEYGLGTCIAANHVKKFFEHLSVFHTEGLVFGDAENPDFPRAMVLLQGKKSGSMTLNHFKLYWWKIVNKVLRFSYSRHSFPLQ